MPLARPSAQNKPCPATVSRTALGALAALGGTNAEHDRRASLADRMLRNWTHVRAQNKKGSVLAIVTAGGGPPSSLRNGAARPGAGGPAEWASARGATRSRSARDALASGAEICKAHASRLERLLLLLLPKLSLSLSLS